MKKCTYCGRENKDDAVNCIECGTLLHEDPFPHGDSQGAGKTSRRYTAFYVGVVFWALLAPKDTGFRIPDEYILTCTVLSVIYCFVIPRFLRLGWSFGLACLLAVLGLVFSIAVPNYYRASGVDPKAIPWLKYVAVSAMTFLYAAQGMFLGLIFYGVRCLFSKRKKAALGNK